MSSKKLSLKEIWPQERDFIVRPDRLKYVRRLKKNEDCVFCESAKSHDPEDAKNLVLYKNKSLQVLLNKYPYNTGHLLVTPKKHLKSLFDLDDKTYTELMLAVRKATKILSLNYDVKGFNIGINHGKVSGAGIPNHLHWHIVPRWYGDTNFFPVIGETKVLPESLEQSWERLMPHFRKWSEL